MHLFGPFCVSTKVVKLCVNFNNVSSNIIFILINIIDSLFDECFLLIPCFAYFSSLKMEAIYSTETLGLFQTTRRYTSTERKEIYIQCPEWDSTPESQCSNGRIECTLLQRGHCETGSRDQAHLIDRTEYAS
jgi:hypothetical protein